MKKGKFTAITLAVAIMITSLAPMMVNAGGLIPKDSGSIVYFEGFEDQSILQTIQSNQKGWSIGGDLEQMALQLGDNLGLPSNAIRFACTNWWKTMWLVLDVEENGKAKKMEQGVNEEAASAEVRDYLSEDIIHVSFQLYFKNDGIENNTRYYIKLKDSSYTPFATLVVTGVKDGESSFDLIALNESKTQNVLYNIANVNSDIYQKPFNIEVAIRRSDNSYRLSINDQIIGVNGNEWIPASNSADLTEASHHTLGDLSLKQIEFDHVNGGWWQCVTIDNISISLEDISADDYVKASYINPVVYKIVDLSGSETDYRVHYELKNNLCMPLNIKAIIALYDENNKIIGLKLKDIEVSARGFYEELVVPCDATPVKAKVFAWDSLDTMAPFASRGETINIETQ